MTQPTLSVVVPLYNEEAVLRELSTRLILACEACQVPFEVIFVDDCSKDRTQQILNELQTDPRIRPQRNQQNAGQYGATLNGLRSTNSQWVVVLDGDLQDPPELIPQMWSEMLAHESRVDVVYAVKVRRGEAGWFQVGQWCFHTMQGALAFHPYPRGAGSYVLCRRRVIERILATPLREANLGAVVAATGAKFSTVPYEKAPRYDKFSRVGFQRLVREALWSWHITGTLLRIGIITFSFLFALSALLFLMLYQNNSFPIWLGFGAGVIVFAGIGVLIPLYRQYSALQRTLSLHQV